MIMQRDTPRRQFLGQMTQILPDKGRLSRAHIVTPPLLRRGDKHRQHPGLRILTGGVQGGIVVQAQIVAQPDQMDCHSTSVASMSVTQP